MAYRRGCGPTSRRGASPSTRRGMRCEAVRSVRGRSELRGTSSTKVALAMSSAAPRRSTCSPSKSWRTSSPESSYCSLKSSRDWASVLSSSTLVRSTIASSTSLSCFLLAQGLSQTQLRLHFQGPGACAPAGSAACFCELFLSAPTVFVSWIVLIGLDSSLVLHLSPCLCCLQLFATSIAAIES
jgi:hypothetical protein